MAVTHFRSLMPMAQPSSVSLALPAFLHAGLGVLGFVLLREVLISQLRSEGRGFLPWFPQIDYWVCAVLPVTILTAWWINRNLDAVRFSARKFGLLCGAVAAAVAAILAAFVFMADLARQPLGYGPVKVLAIFWIFAGLWVGAGIAFAAMMGSLVGAYAAKLVLRLDSFRSWPISGVAWLIVGVLATAATVAIAGRASDGIGLIDRLTQYDRLAAFPARITAKLIVRGEPVTLERTVLCRRPISTREEAQAHQADLPSPFWLPNNKSFGQVLADGSAIFLITPDMCRSMAMARAAGTIIAAHNVLPANYRPLIGWTPNAAAMETFDLYVDGTAYARADAPVRIVSMEMSYAPQAETISSLDLFALIGWRVFPHVGEYGAFYAAPFTAEKWMKNPFASVELPLLTSPEFVFGLREERRLANGQSKYGDLRDWDRLYVARNGAGIPDEPSVSVGTDDFGFDVKPRGRPVFPLRREGNQWRLSHNEPGVLAFYRGLRTKISPPPYPASIEIDGRLVQRGDRQTGDYLYDPNSRLLYRIEEEEFNLAKPDNIFASW